MGVGVLGATVMPHNLYLHSHLVVGRPYERSDAGLREAVRHATVDVVLSLTGAMLLNSGILVLAASVFHANGRNEVTEVQEAHRLLSPLLGTTLAGAVFAMALLAAGQSATITRTMAGQVIMGGFVRVRLRAWQRRLLTRGLGDRARTGRHLVAGKRCGRRAARGFAGGAQPSAPLRRRAAAAPDGRPAPHASVRHAAVDDRHGVGVRRARGPRQRRARSPPAHLAAMQAAEHVAHALGPIRRQRLRARLPHDVKRAALVQHRELGAAVGRAPERQIHGGSPDAEVAELELREPRRQMRVDEQEVKGRVQVMAPTIA